MNVKPSLASALWDVRPARVAQFVQPLAIFGIALLALWALRRLALRWLRRRANGSGNLAGVMADAVRVPSLLWCVAGALEISLRYADLTERQVHAAGIWIVIFVIVSLSLALASGTARAIALYGQRRQVPFAVAGLSRTLTHVFVLSIGAMVLMHYLGLDIRPMLTALGVGGLAVALALQDTLANFFAGIHILMEEPISVGHFVRLSTGEEGTVTDIGWRTTRVRTGSNNIVVIPNTRITSGILVNFSLPEPRAVVEIPVLASLKADAARVRDLILDVALRSEGILREPAPSVVFDPGVTPTHQQFRLFVCVEQQTQRAAVASTFNLALWERFRAEGIPLPETGLVSLIRP